MDSRSLPLNQKGNVVIFILIGFLIIALLPPIIMHFVPAAGLLFQILMIFIIYSTVRGYLGQGKMSIIVSVILIYFLVFKYRDITASLWVFQLMLSIQFLSVLVWGIGTRMRKE